MPDPLTFSIVATDGKLSFDDLLRSVEGVRKLIRDVDHVVTRRNTRRQWHVTGFHSSSPTISITPVPDQTGSGRRSVEALVTGIQWINEPGQETPPEFFSERELEDIRALRQRRLLSVSRIEFSSNGTAANIVPSRVSEQVDRILGAGHVEYGSLEGTLEAINVHNTRTVTIWESLSRLAVRCWFPEEYEEAVSRLLRRRVRISGLVRYFADGRPQKITEIGSIEDLSPDPSLVRATFGSIPDLTGGLGSERYLRVMRGT